MMDAGGRILGDRSRKRQITGIPVVETIQEDPLSIYRYICHNRHSHGLERRPTGDSITHPVARMA